MTDKRVWFITGAGRGTGADIAKAVLDAGHRLIATGRDTERLTQVVGSSADLLAVKLDVTRRDDADAAVRAAVERFGQFWPRRLVV
jgi:NADP-dependent 3-hydroxy acid dehydrogenase YdfG